VIFAHFGYAALLLCAAPVITAAQSGGGDSDLAKQTQNPVAKLISVPLEFEFVSGMALAGQSRNTFTLKPVLPTVIGRGNMLVWRTLVPFVNAPAADSSRDTGVGDITEQVFFTPEHPGRVVWGFGPLFSFPTASNASARTGDWGMGPAAVVLTSPGHWTIGALLTQTWTVSGDDDGKDINVFTVQPFIHYNLAHGYTISTAPTLKANWQDSDVWTVPLGAGVSKIVALGKQPMSLSLYYYNYVVRPSSAGNSELKLTTSFLFPALEKR